MRKMFFVLVLASLLLAACGGGATEAPAATTDEKVEIRVWGHQAPAFNEANQKMFNDFIKTTEAFKRVSDDKLDLKRRLE